MERRTEPLDVLVIGAGQAGLALGRELQRRGVGFGLVDAGTRIGDVWRSRWDSLRLFTAAEYDGLPDLPFPATAGTHPGKDAVAAYLELYAETFGLPVALGTRVTRLAPADRGFVAETGDGAIAARRVVVATGAFGAPHVPGWAPELAPEVVQLHSTGYRRPADLPDGPVLVVGAGNSGVQIAEELAGSGRPVTLAVGTRPRAVPQRLLGRDLFWWLTRSGLMRVTADSRPGRRLRDRELVIGTSWPALRARGIELRPRAVSASGTTVGFADGGSLDAAGVVWATGFRPDWRWLDVPDAVADGRVRHTRGVSPVPGLYFLGLPWQHTRGSALLGFVAEDAAHLAGLLGAGTREPVAG
ncbi:flavin-containing monooxygenase [Geodermatophilus ruber]|uniref:flavin-containing monooxygenase n=1 Tax=Geodermatophilus ruber TaxID=504800 RepID=UPI001FE0311D|nr:NAD(P)/FAD-dependent oxidoreductase [Geodermatophilus ruber]